MTFASLLGAFAWVWLVLGGAMLWCAIAAIAGWLRYHALLQQAIDAARGARR
jgi:hypothetical protein